MPLARVFRRFLLIAAAFSLVINLVMLGPSLFMLQVYDRVLVSRSMETLVMLGIITSAWLMLGLVLDVLRQRVLAHAASRLDRGFGTALLGSLLEGAAGPGRRIETGQLKDLSVVRGFIGGPAVLAIFDAPWIVIYLGVMALFHPLMGAAAAAAAVVLWLLAIVANRFSAAPAARAQLAGARAGQFVQASLRAADAVVVHGMSGAIAKAWLGDHAQALEDGRAASRVTAGFGALTRALRQWLQVLMLGLGAWLVVEQHVSAGVTIAATILLGRMLSPLESIAGHWKSIVEARDAWRRLSGEVQQLEADAAVFELPAPAGRLEISGLSFRPSADAAPTLRNINLVVEPGETLVIVGHSGSGKSTLARLVTGAWKPTTGTIRLDGIDLASWDRAALGPHLGYCPQDVQLINGTVAQNIARFGDGDSAGVVAAARRARCEEMIARLPRHYETEIGEGGSLLSGGQRQRVALARALYGKPRLVILDEPNASLDSDGERLLDEVLKTLRAEGITTLVVTQRSQVIEQADKVLVMNDGAIERLGRRRAEGERDAAAAQALHVVKA